MASKAPQSIRRFCLECQGGSSRAVQGCVDRICPLHTVRLGPHVHQPHHSGPENGPHNTPGNVPEHEAACGPEHEPGFQNNPEHLSAPEQANEPKVRHLRLIRNYCINCAASRQDVRQCDAKTCHLWPYRFGVSPATFKRVLNRIQQPQALLLPGLPPRQG